MDTTLENVTGLDHNMKQRASRSHRRLTLAWVGMVALLAITTACGPSESSHADARKHIADAESTKVDSAITTIEPQRFVQEFYDWYLVTADNHHGGPAWYAAFQRMPPPLHPGLLTDLRNDSIIKAKSPGDLTGLDFDPYLASQDPCERYEAGDVTGSGTNRRVAVHAVCSGIRSQHPHVIVEVEQHDGSWIIANVLYADHSTDLRTLLRDIHK